MIEQIQENKNHNKISENGNKTEFQSTMVFSNIVSCCVCGIQMEFIENDVIYGENWYHGTCWKKAQEEKQNV